MNHPHFLLKIINRAPCLRQVFTLLRWMVVIQEVAFLLVHDIRVHFTTLHYSWNHEKQIKISSILGLLTVYSLRRFYCDGPSWLLLHCFSYRDTFSRHQHLTYNAKAGQRSWAFQRKISFWGFFKLSISPQGTSLLNLQGSRHGFYNFRWSFSY